MDGVGDLGRVPADIPQSVAVAVAVSMCGVTVSVSTRALTARTAPSDTSAPYGRPPGAHPSRPRPRGLSAGSPEEALDCACGLYLNDPTA
jgi:hypothetical protein